MANDIKIIGAISSLKPGAEYSLRNGVVEWLDSKQTEPTQAEINTEMIRLKAEWDAQEYARKREAEYPSIVDVTVALAEKMEGQPHFWNEITALRLEVKSKYPKP